MKIHHATREVIDNPVSVARVVACGENDGGVYTIIVNLMHNEMYVLDCNGKLVEETSLRIDNGVIYGHLQNYL